jgi:hypothetical protein
MSLLTRPEQQASNGVSLRSAASWDFEVLWRSLPRDGFVPKRTAFRPERAPRFLRDFVMCDVVMGEKPEVRIRVTGTNFDARVQMPVQGQNYIEYLPAQYRDGVINSVRQIVERPCGLWQVMTVHYRRGFAQNLEITVFPLANEAGDAHQLLVLAREAEGLARPRSTGDLAMSADTALTYQFIDIGAGVPLT